MIIKPENLAKEIYNKLSDLEKIKIKNNLPNFGRSIFVKFNFTEEQSKEFLRHLGKLLDEV